MAHEKCNISHTFQPLIDSCLVHSSLCKRAQTKAGHLIFIEHELNILNEKILERERVCLSLLIYLPERCDRPCEMNLHLLFFAHLHVSLSLLLSLSLSLSVSVSLSLSLSLSMSVAKFLSKRRRSRISRYAKTHASHIASTAVLSYRVDRR
jgi:hypothetical protein